MMLQLRLVQSRSQAGSFYVKDVTDETIASVSKSVGLDDIQASQLLYLTVIPTRVWIIVVLQVRAIMCMDLTKPLYVYHSWAMNPYVL